MLSLTIDNQTLQVAAGTTLLDAARQLGIYIPTLCHVDGFKPSTSCMVCVVQVQGYKHLMPACGTQAVENMVVTTDSDEIRAARKTAIELLLSDHLGDCQGPCQRGCPAGMNIPKMLRAIAAGRLDEAIAVVKQDIPLPAILGRICTAPCEKVCRRTQADEAVSICLLKRFVADVDLASGNPYCPPSQPSIGKKVAVIGAGPCGLSAAYYLSLAGIDCTLYDRQPRPGGSLLADAIDCAVLDETVIEREIEQILKTGVVFQGSTVLGKDIFLDVLQKDYDAVLLAIGRLDPDQSSNLGIAVNENKIPVTRPDYMALPDGVFAAGSCIGSRTLPVRAVADGKEAARSIQSSLTETALSAKPIYNHRMGRLKESEIPAFMQTASADHRKEPQSDVGLTEQQASQQAARCLHCDCRKADACRLRDRATELNARQKAFESGPKLFEQIIASEGLLFESGKCIKCGVCVQLAGNNGEALGLTFQGRGFAMRVTAPLDETFIKNLQKNITDYVKICPTGAFSLK